jgi:hypothetical protein
LEPERDEATGGWRKLHNEELRDFAFFAKCQVDQDEIGDSCSTNSEKRNVFRLLVGKPRGRKQLGRPRCKWVYNIKMELGDIGIGGVDWIGLA